MRRALAMRMLLALGVLALCATLAACGAEVQGEQAGGAAANAMAGAGSLAGGGGGASGAAGGGSPEVCTPGIPGTTQIPRLLNRQYEAVVRDLLGVTGVGAD